MAKVSFGKRVVSALAAVTLAFGCMVPSVALAAPSSSYVTGAASRAAGPITDILGVTGIEESGQFIADEDPTSQGSDGALTATQLNNWVYPKYLLLGSSTYNVEPNPYMAYNLTNGLTTGSNADTDVPYGMIVNARNGAGGGPSQPLVAYNSLYGVAEVGSTDNGVWTDRPDVIVGTGGTDSYTYYSAIAAAIDLSYSPSSVNYAFSLYADIIASMYKAAYAADLENSQAVTKTLRYDDGTGYSARNIALKYEKFIKGIQGYVLKRLADENKSKKTVALVTNVSGSSAGNYTYTLLENDAGTDGTASTNRYLEATGAVADNYTDSAGTAEASSSELQGSGVDLILVGGQSSSSNYSAIMAALSDDNLLGKAYWVDGNAGYHGACYGTVMNSVENAQNIARILGMLYPEYVSQSQMVAYYYANFYHIKSAAGDNQIPTVIAQAMDGVRNYNVDASTSSNPLYDCVQWSASDVSGYDPSITEGYITQGCAYILAHTSTVPSTLLPLAGSSFTIPSAYL